MRHVVFRRLPLHSLLPLLVCFSTASLGTSALAQVTGTTPTGGASTGGATTGGAATADSRTSTEQPAAALTGPKTAVYGEFPLEAGDVLAVTVTGHPELSGTLPVTDAGKVSLPLLGNLTVVGKTVAQAEKAITAACRTELNNPEVTVILVSTRPRQVLMVGSVKQGGSIDLHFNWRVSEAIDAAGGLSAEPDDIIATLARGKGQPIPLDLPKIVDTPQNAANLTLKAGDILKFNLIPGRTITVTGDVKTPQAVTLRRGSRLLDALSAAGELIQGPATSRITLVRGGHETLIDGVTAYRQRESAANVQLLNGDLIVVRAIRTNISIVALHDEVQHSGNLTMEGQPHVLQAVLAAGLNGPPEQVDISIRRGAEKIPVDLERAAYDPTYDVSLQNGDVLLFAPLDGPAVRVAGGVNKPGQLNLGKDATLLDAILATGGLVNKPEDVKLSILRHNDGKQTVLNVDPVALISLHDLGQNVQLHSGDLIMVNPAQTRTVFISGEVNSPSAYQMGENDGLVELLLRAGGPTSFAALTKVQILRRDSTTLTVDISKATAPGAARLPVNLEVGDVVTVPRNTNQVLVMNAVNRPGYIPFPENGTLTIGDALLQAGGAQSGARLQEVAVLHRLPNGEVNQKIVPVNQVAKVETGTTKTTLAIDTPLQAGDIVYVPQGKVNKSILSSALGTIGSLGVLRSVFF